MEHSAAILYTKKEDGQLYILMGHATNTPFWDLPKGHIELGEGAKEAAIRESQEEIGFTPAADMLVDLCRFPYRETKTLDIFAYIREAPFPAIKDLYCTAMHERDGDCYPEMDAYAWVDYRHISSYAGPAMVKLLKRVFDHYNWLK